MSPTGTGGGKQELSSEFERQTLALLEDSVTRIEGRVRSRLTQARHAAIAEASRSRGRMSFLGRFTLMPAASAVAAAALVAFFLWPQSHPHQAADSLVAMESGQRTTVEDLDLLADSDALDLVSDEADSGAFYEWAAAQADSNETSS
jgi:hypothetical protein